MHGKHNNRIHDFDSTLNPSDFSTSICGKRNDELLDNLQRNDYTSRCGQSSWQFNSAILLIHQQSISIINDGYERSWGPSVHKRQRLYWQGKFSSIFWFRLGTSLEPNPFIDWKFDFDLLNRGFGKKRAVGPQLYHFSE